MSSITDKLREMGLIKPPVFLKNNIHYEVIMGSVAYGCSNDLSDMDIYGFCIPPKNVIFPHLDGYIEGFSTKKNRFDQFQQHHVYRKDNQRTYDLNIYNIVKYFKLCMDNNPNMIDSLFVSRRCILHSTQVGEHLRDNRHLFLHKGAWYKFRGYSFGQLNKCENKAVNEWIDYCNKKNISFYSTFEELKEIKFFKSSEEQEMVENLLKKVYQNGKLTNRIESIAKYGYSLKFAYHIVRLLNEIEQILTEGDLDLERDREILKSVRRGDWSFKEIREWFTQKEKDLESLYIKSELRYKPNEEKIRNLLLECLELHYDNVDNCIVNPNSYRIAINEIKEIVNNLKRSKNYD